MAGRLGIHREMEMGCAAMVAIVHAGVCGPGLETERDEGVVRAAGKSVQTCELSVNTLHPAKAPRRIGAAPENVCSGHTTYLSKTLRSSDRPLGCENALAAETNGEPRSIAQRG
jgi:hypothetical protein